jgi:hypothetical protein
MHVSPEREEPPQLQACSAEGAELPKSHGVTADH